MSRFINRTLRNIARYIQESMYSEEYAKREGLLQKVDSRIRLIVLVGSAFFVVCAGSIEMILILLLISLVLATASKIPIGSFLPRVWFFVPIFAGVIAIPAMFNVVSPGRDLIEIFSFETWHLSITEEGLRAATILVLRVASSVSFIVLLPLTTRWNDLMNAMRVLKIPKTFVLILSTTYRYIFFLLDSVNKMLLSMKSRDVGKLGVRKSWRIYAPMVSALFIKSYSLNEKVYLAMMSRGFSGEVRTAERKPLDIHSIGFLGICILIYAVLVMAYSVNLVKVI